MSNRFMQIEEIIYDSNEKSFLKKKIDFIHGESEKFNHSIQDNDNVEKYRDG